MAFPQVSSANSGSQPSPTTFHIINLPTGIASGNLLIAVFVVGNNPASITGWPTGWTHLTAGADPNNGSTTYVRYKIATGGETNFTLTTSTSQRSVHHTYRVTGWHGTTPPEANLVGPGASAAPDPPALTPSWGALDTLWMALCGYANSPTVTAYPSLYTANQANTIASLSCGLGVATRNAAFGSENPVAFSLSSSTGWVASTIAIRPAIANPTASFTYDNTTPLSITFDSSSSSAVSPATITGYNWDFGDVSPASTAANPTHTYATAGTKSVTLTVTDSNGLTNNVTVAVHVLSSLAVSAATSSEGSANRLVTKTLQADTPLDATIDSRTYALALSDATSSEGTAGKLVTKVAQASTASAGTLSPVSFLPSNRQGLAVRRDAQGRGFINPNYLTGSRRDAQGRGFIDPDATAGVARLDAEGRGFIQYNFYGAISSADTIQEVSATKLVDVHVSSQTDVEVSAPKLVMPSTLEASTSSEGFFDAFIASIVIMVAETLSEASANRLVNKIADAGTACEATVSKLANRTLDAATAAVGSAVKLVTKNATAETANPATATKVVQLKPLASTACVGTALKLVLTGVKLATTNSTGILLGGVQVVKSLVFTLGSYLAGKRGSIEPRVNLFLSNIHGDEIEPITTGESMSVNLANGRDHTWELAVRMAHSDVFDPLTDIVKPTLDYWNGETWDRFPLGLYRMSHPNEENLEHIKFWNLKGRSLESLLAEDMAPGSYSVPKNAGILLEVKTILRTVFEVPDEAINFPAANEEVLLASPMFFDVASATEQCYWLPICNSLLAAGGFTPLQTDSRGRFYTRKYQDPNIRQPDIRYGMGGDEIINAESAINIDRDASEFANRVIVISNDTTVAPIAAIAANHNPQSPYSIENLRKTVTKTVTLQNVVSSAEASLMAQVELARRSGIFEKLAFQTAPDPRRGPAEVLELHIEDDNGDPVISGLWMYEGWSMNLEPLSLQDHTASRITTVT